MKDKYLCDCCGEEWGFIEEDYPNKEHYPTTCPLCSMPVSQMIHDVFLEEGFFAVIRQLFLRYL